MPSEAEFLDAFPCTLLPGMMSLSLILPSLAGYYHSFYCELACRPQPFFHSCESGPSSLPLLWLFFA